VRMVDARARTTLRLAFVSCDERQLWRSQAVVRLAHALDDICCQLHNLVMPILLTTEEFADWFRDLADREAEEAATALEVLERLAPDEPAPNSRDLLLWYQAAPSAADDPLDHYVGYAARVQRIVAHLDSDPVQKRITSLGLRRAEFALAAISGIRVSARQLRLMLRLQEPRVAERSFEEIDRNYRIALEAGQLMSPSSSTNSQALRELNLREQAPGARILYGIDAPRERALLILGEPLDRRAYGPSVRRALRIWAEFLAQATTHDQPFEPRSCP
jgi:hypothetical protein